MTPTAAGVGMIFARLMPGGEAFEGPVGSAAIRPYSGTWCRWTNNPAFGITSLTGGSGVRVRSFDQQGNFPEEVLDHRTVDFSNKGWLFGTQHNYWSQGDSWQSFEGGKAPMGFVIKPHRVYIAWVWYYLYAEARNMTSFGYAKAALEADIYGARLTQF